MIVATGVTNNAADNRQLLGMIDAVQENLEHPPEQVVADAGYKSEENFEGLEKREIDGYISLWAERGEIQSRRKISPPRFACSRSWARRRGKLSTAGAR